MWIAYAAGSAVCAALVAILAKIGLKGVDPTTATIVRGVIMGAFLLLVGLLLRKFEGLGGAAWDTRAWTFIILSAIAGALSWILYFSALKVGPAGPVAVIDKLSVVLVIIMAALFFGEAFTLRSALGVVLTIAGSVLIVFS
jgi:bacterial/archaeal transporter family protein